MREVQFRTIDRVFIRMSINDKMWVIFLLFLSAITTIAGMRYWHTLASIEQQSQLAVEYKLQGLLNHPDPSQLSVLKVQNRVSDTIYSQGVVTASATSANGQAYAYTESMKQYEQLLASKPCAAFYSHICGPFLLPFSLTGSRPLLVVPCGCFTPPPRKSLKAILLHDSVSIPDVMSSGRLVVRSIKPWIHLQS